METSPLIFLSYASADQEDIVYFYERLRSAGLEVWMDKYSLKGGQNWDVEIKKALRRSTIIVCFISERSVNKRGYVQREIKIALDYALEKLEDDIFIIPVKLNSDAPLPDQLSHIHAISGTREEQVDCTLDSIFSQLRELGQSPSIAKEPEKINCEKLRVSEAWEGLPGYEARFDTIRISSEKYKNTNEINSLVNGVLYRSLHQLRRNKFQQNTAVFNFGQESFQRTDSWSADCEEVLITGNTLSLNFSVYWYGSGAAHGNSHFLTFSFSLDPLIYVEKLDEIFQDADEALGELQAVVRNSLLSQNSSEEIPFEKKWLDSGTKDWDDLSSFMFTTEGIKILFPPYQIAPYAAGSHSVVVPYAKIVGRLDQNFQNLLGLSYLTRMQADQGLR